MTATQTTVVTTVVVIVVFANTTASLPWNGAPQCTAAQTASLAFGNGNVP